ncbi:VRR-NUC domain-containing protein [Billgrantia endophytica]|uniref:phosphodiesterase I n=1 Tax=Billgrantia endophytica TaxID=2033802 RepID=A0A2N7U632_9GAMM|nr:VRR-NUC domain-containing protein [Halomonas endophytica]PMR75893.1 nuclease [Halomonas endophytica]
MNSILPAIPVTAPLDDPFYYLTNFRFVLGWVSERHDDLLGEPERDFIAGFARMPLPSQALLVRMVMRKGEHFRTSRLGYDEIGDPLAALEPLVAAGWVEDDPPLTLDELFRQLRLGELRRALGGDIVAAGLPALASKAALLATLLPMHTTERRLGEWWPGVQAGERIVRLTVMPVCERLRLMFFGNLHQGWAEFVLAELGVQRFERVTFGAESRAFQRREQVDAYLMLHRLRERLEQGESPGVIRGDVPEVPEGNAWLAERRARLLYRLGQQAERAGQHELALTLYADGGCGESGQVDARIRRLRLLERLGEHGRALALASLTFDSATGDTPVSETECQAIERLLPRLRRRLGLPAATRPSEPTPERWEYRLERQSPGGTIMGVEQAVCVHLSRPDAPVYYVENALLTGLFGLLCWPALFAPLPGAFFHPFHSGPADLYRHDFVARRRDLFDACLARLEDGSYREAILATWHDRQGVSSPFVYWDVLDETLIDRALACIPASHLHACFDRMLADLRANRAGLPDLIQFLPEDGPDQPRYRLIEVKGPGDRLQDNQRRWLAFFHAQGIPTAVCHVTWQSRDAAS